ncbi:MAG: N-acetylglucosamine kinase, partial [Planctomycetia bacterium]|nr:N-acetylglucosamine kinase [Planctomycetia bacterium]
MTPTDDRLLLGVDGGGTSTVAWLASPGGRVLGRGTSGPSNAKAVGPSPARGALERAIAGAFADARLARVPASSACLGVAGFGRPEDHALLRAWSEELGWSTALLPVTDGDLVVAAGTPQGWGIGVIAGTGSIVVGRAAGGRTARAGGWGHLIGDEGSAYAVVLDALRLVVRRADGRDPKPAGDDPLTRRLCLALNAASPPGIVAALYDSAFDRTRIAALAPEVLAAAGEEPALTDLLLVPAGAALAWQARAVARALDWTSGAIPLA